MISRREDVQTRDHREPLGECFESEVTTAIGAVLFHRETARERTGPSSFRLSKVLSSVPEIRRGRIGAARLNNSGKAGGRGSVVGASIGVALTTTCV